MSTKSTNAALLDMADRVKRLSDHDAIPSPCFSVCKMDDEGGFCLGCMRTTEEITRWGKADKPYQRQVWSLIEKRAKAASA